MNANITYLVSMSGKRYLKGLLKLIMFFVFVIFVFYFGARAQLVEHDSESLGRAKIKTKKSQKHKIL